MSEEQTTAVRAPRFRREGTFYRCLDIGDFGMRCTRDDGHEGEHRIYWLEVIS